MKRYIGVKVVNAKPMTRQEYNDFRGWNLPVNEDGADDGYLVEYVDGSKANTEQYKGYVSWSPVDVFKRSYFEREKNSVAFCEAFAALKIRAKISRESWNGKGQYVVMVKPADYELLDKFDTDKYQRQPFLALKNAQGLFQPGWVPSMGDLFAEDWVIHYEND